MPVSDFFSQTSDNGWFTLRYGMVKFHKQQPGEPDLSSGEVDPRWLRGVIVIGNCGSPADPLDFVLTVFNAFNPELFRALRDARIGHKLDYRFYKSDDPLTEKGSFPAELDLNEIAGPTSAMYIQDGAITAKTGRHVAITIITVFAPPTKSLERAMCPHRGPLVPINSPL